ncbi:MAG TPA: cytochrome c peroxidase [Burkholderiales bacterium]|nr:cytochrome c peroxidase [Burkholderiales bacterium]
MLSGALMLASGALWAQNLGAPPSLKGIPVPEPANLSDFVKNKSAAIALGKALFWDMQVGSDSVQACASCHFHAGADNRFRNVVSPGLNAGDTTFQSVGPNGVLSQDKFPFTQFADPGNQTSALVKSWNDVVSSPGVYNTTYAGQPRTPGAVEQGTSVPDPVFNVGGVNTRRVEPRNAPTVINAVFNFNNFWDGRADSVFNGSSPLGDADPDAGVWVTPQGVSGAAPFKQRVRIPFSSLASQAVGPPGSPFEMSFAGRSFPEIGKKLLNPKIVPLGNQNVHPRDSVLGPLANSTISRNGVMQRPGLKTTYADMVRAAFNDQYWNGGPPFPGTYSHMEANFALFFGLAVQLYEATLVSDDSPFDRFMDGDPNAMSASAQEGLNIFLGVNEPGGVGGNCVNCHGTSSFSNASVMHVGATNFGASLPEGIIERMIMGDGGGSWYDSGYYDIAVRPIPEDLGRAGNTPFTGLRDSAGNPLLGPNGQPVPIPLSFIDRALMKAQGVQFPAYMDTSLIPALPCGTGFQLACPSDSRVSTRGAFKVPTLRNVELTGPYMHNGGDATLMQVIDFYSRGGNFQAANTSTFDPDVQVLCGLNPNPDPVFCGAVDPAVAEANQNKLVDFLLALTDDRVRWEKAPFDHPALAVPNGATVRRSSATDNMLNLPAVGADGLAAELLPPIGPFLNLDPHLP